MSKKIFRSIGGVVRPMIVDDVMASDAQCHYENRTPRYKLKNNLYDKIELFIIPNVKCNECGKEVFYYENKNGARVLFDFLGPPWPVHPCYATEQEKKIKTPLKKKRDGFLLLWRNLLLCLVVEYAFKDDMEMKLFGLNLMLARFLGLDVNLMMFALCCVLLIRNGGFRCRFITAEKYIKQNILCQKKKNPFLVV